jgi:hypothetical protein
MGGGVLFRAAQVHDQQVGGAQQGFQLRRFNDQGQIQTTVSHSVSFRIQAMSPGMEFSRDM